VREYPRGTWIISVEVAAFEAMKLYEQGVLTGLSITVKEKEHADTIINFLNDNDIPYLPEEVVDAEKGFYKKPKRILMKDVINPVAFTVSLVKQPCVYGAKFCRNSCLIVNEEKLKENKILNLKEKIKSEINNIIDGLDVEEAMKEDIVEESEKEGIKSTEESEKEEVDSVEEEAEKDSEKCGGNNKTKTIYGRKVKVEAKKSETEETEEEVESIKDDGTSGDGKGDGDSGGENTGGTTTGGTTTGGTTTGGTTTGGENTSGETATGETATGETTANNSEADSDDKGDGTGKKNIVKESKKEDIKETNTETESEKEVLYLAQDDVENLISTTLRRYAEEIEQMVFDGIQEALDDYLFASSYKEEKEPDEDEDVELDEDEEVEESQKQYATPEMVQSMFDEQFGSFKSSIMDGIKKAQKESIKSYSKAITPSDDGFGKEAKKESNFKPKVERDFNGCRIRKR